MVELRTLGGLELEATCGLEGAAVQPKRLALLAYLAVARPAGYLRRDVLLALFWPDLPAPRARLALRQALHHLRSVARASTIQARGSTEVAARGELVLCDACAFEAECAAGRGRTALALYQGEFLDGVHVAGASAEFEEWVTGRRRYYHDLAVCAAWSLVTEAERAGDFLRAVAAAERAMQLAPDDEPGLRRLMLLLEGGGNRSTALRHYERFARRLATDLGTGPSPHTRTLAERLRLEGRQPLAT